MNHTSAYANVLLKPSVAAPVVAAPKRDNQDDFSPADFHQTFKDVQDSQKSQDDKVHKPAKPKKSTQVEHHHEPKNTKALKEVKEAVEKLTDDSSDINRNAIKHEVVREQPVQHKNKVISADKPSHGEPAQAVSNLVTDINPDASQNTLVSLNTLNGRDIGVNQKALAFGTELSIVTEAPVSTIADVSITTGVPLPTDIPQSILTQAQGIPVPAGLTGSLESIDSTIPLSSPVTTSVTNASVAANTITLETENLANVLQTTDLSVKAEKIGEMISQPSVVNEPLLGQNLSQPIADHSLTISINQSTKLATPVDAQVLVASVVVSAAPVKPLQPQVALAEMSEVSKDVVDFLAPLAAEASAKLPSASSLAATNNTTSPEVTTAQVQMNASKTAFEKTLQSIASPDASSADDIATSLSNSSSTNSATNPLMDSLMRGTDQQSPAARSFVVQTAVPVPVGQPQWSQAVGEKVLWLAAQNVSSAEINLHPKDLGPMQVRVSVNQEQTTVSFTSQHAVVREVLDQNLNRLRDMFSEQGLNLVNVDVSDKSFSRQQGDAQNQKAQSGANEVVQDEEVVVAMSAIVQQRLVDHYA